MKMIKARLRQFITENGGNAAEIARQIGVQPTYFGSILSVESKGLSSTIIIGFAKQGWDVQWLLTGESRLSIADKRISDLESEVKDANNLINSLEKILGSK